MVASTSYLSRTLPSTRRAFSAASVRFVQPQEREVVPTGGGHERQITSETAMVTGGPSPAEIAMPKTPANVPHDQAPGRTHVWSRSQNPRDNAMRGPRFEQMNMAYQPQPVAAIEWAADEEIRLVDTRIAACDGGGGPLGHPKVFINLDKPGSKACGYWCGRYSRIDLEPTDQRTAAFDSSGKCTRIIIDASCPCNAIISDLSLASSRS